LIIVVNRKGVKARRGIKLKHSPKTKINLYQVRALTPLRLTTHPANPPRDGFRDQQTPRQNNILFTGNPFKPSIVSGSHVSLGDTIHPRQVRCKSHQHEVHAWDGVL
jgi:hypothetical protein